MVLVALVVLVPKVAVTQPVLKQDLVVEVADVPGCICCVSERAQESWLVPATSQETPGLRSDHLL